MAAYEAAGRSNEWYTPLYIFEALGCRFDMDVASPEGVKTLVPANRFLTASTPEPWSGFIFMNPPFGHQSTKRAWMTRFFDHGNGIALTPDRTSAPWFREAWPRADAVMFIPKVKFYAPDSAGDIRRFDSPGTGTALWAGGDRAVAALSRAAERGLGIMSVPMRIKPAGTILQPRDGTYFGDLDRLGTFMGEIA